MEPINTFEHNVTATMKKKEKTTTNQNVKNTVLATPDFIQPEFTSWYIFVAGISGNAWIFLNCQGICKKIVFYFNAQILGNGTVSVKILLQN